MEPDMQQNIYLILNKHRKGSPSGKCKATGTQMKCFCLSR